uniref:Uncharacterized protein n=1 Tax=Neogobius melanostomus TaxID=47308 RepID=A0A8C6T6H6_9GOBI
MPGAQRLWIVALSLVLLVSLLPQGDARRGGGRGGGFGRGGGGFGRGGYRPVQSSGPSAGKVAGAAAVGAIGGSMLGSALSRPGYGYGGYGGGYGGYGGGYGGYGGGYGGAPRGYGRSGYDQEGSGDMGYYYGAASSGPIYNSIIVVIGTLVALLMGSWATIM